MNPAAGCLDYGAVPPFAIPMRFFAVAAVFGIGAGVGLIAWPEALSSRWQPAAFALTHLIAVGFMLMVMIGALYQILPVVAGASIRGGRALATIVQGMLTLGTVALAWGLAAMQPALLTLAANLLAPALALFLAACAAGLYRRALAMDAQRDLRLALVGLGAAVLLGATLVMIMAHGWALPFRPLLDIHVAWALIGGAGMLLAATSWIVVPMFQITPAYPSWLSRFWGRACVLVLLGWSAAHLLAPPSVQAVLLPLLLALPVVFVLATLDVQRRTRKARADVTGRGFAVGMLCLLAGLTCVVLASRFVDPRWAVAAGVLILYGGFAGVTQAMLYKIVPFLAWLHLTQAGLKAPNMKQLQPDDPVRAQARVHLLALSLVLAAAIMPDQSWLVRLAGTAVTLDFSWLLLNQLRVLRAYRQVLNAGQTRPKALVSAGTD